MDLKGLLMYRSKCQGKKGAIPLNKWMTSAIPLKDKDEDEIFNELKWKIVKNEGSNIEFFNEVPLFIGKFGITAQVDSIGYQGSFEEDYIRILLIEVKKDLTNSQNISNVIGQLFVDEFVFKEDQEIKQIIKDIQHLKNLEIKKIVVTRKILDWGFELLKNLGIKVYVKEVIPYALK